MRSGSFVDAIVDAERIGVHELAKRLGVHPATVFRWTTRGVRGIRLRKTWVGGRTVVTSADLTQFMHALNSVGGEPGDSTDRRES